MNKKGDILWTAVLLAVSALLLAPATNKIYLEINSAHPYLLGFVKFFLLATMGELIALRIIDNQWKKTKGMLAKAVIWGIIGILIVFMFKFYSTAVNGLADKGMIFIGEGIMRTILGAFFTSAIMNLTFAPVFMACHRISDTYIDMKVDGSDPTLKKVINKIEWPNFMTFVVGKTVPFFWIPAHTIVFTLPETYRILSAAYLSIALGIILATAKKKAATAPAGRLANE